VLIEAGGTEHYVVGVPLAEAVVGAVGRFGFVDDGGHAVGGLVAVEHLDLEAVPDVDAAVASLVDDEGFRAYANQERYQIAQQARLLASGETEREIVAQVEAAGYTLHR